MEVSTTCWAGSRLLGVRAGRLNDDHGSGPQRIVLQYTVSGPTPVVTGMLI